MISFVFVWLIVSSMVPTPVNLWYVILKSSQKFVIKQWHARSVLNPNKQVGFAQRELGKSLGDAYLNIFIHKPAKSLSVIHFMNFSL